ncbi:MAG: hypothetical protein JRH20_12555 [Deltaproteobacteria bacterium]|nr:hypothetical protein [Deltaproteobacteria bacterium]
MRSPRRLLSSSLVGLFVGLIAACSSTPHVAVDAGDVSDASDGLCTNCPAGLTPGVVGRFSSLAALGSSVVVAAYEERFGDLVLVSAQGELGSESKYEIIDGVPMGDAPTHALDGYRGGISSPGDDVGHGTSLATTDDGAPWASYHDSTHAALKYAHRDAQGWAAHTVAQPTTNSQERVGLQTAATYLEGKPIIAYLVTGIELDNGRFVSELRLARAKSAAPTSSDDWQHEMIAQGHMPCDELCAEGKHCFILEDGTACQEATTDCDACADDTACLDGQCLEILESIGAEGSVIAFGTYPRIMVDGASTLVAFHDAVEGGVGLAHATDGQWQWSKLPLTPPYPGAFLSALLDTEGVHLAYQDGQSETLHYALIDKTTLAVINEELVDDGRRVEGKHILGADSALTVDAQGKIHIVYQDQTSAELLYVSRGTEGWEPSVAAEDGAGRVLLGGPRGYGFYNGLATIDGQIHGSTFWVDAAGETPGGLEFFTLP